MTWAVSLLLAAAAGEGGPGDRRPWRLAGYRLSVPSARADGGLWVIPAAYRRRPHLAEPKRMCTHRVISRWLIERGPEPEEDAELVELYPQPDPWLAPVPDDPPFPPGWRAVVPAPPQPRVWTLEERRRPGLRLRFR